MKITLSLIKSFLDIKKDLADISHLLTLAGIEVDKIENETPSFTNIVSAKILEVQKHPSSDKLVITKIFDGKETHQVVCGDPTCKKDMVVAFAKEGATLKDEKNNLVKIKKTKLRGVESYGMLCSASELKLFEETENILELDSDFELGEDLTYLSDPIFEISLTPNLGHLLSAIGIARELACLTKERIKMSPLELKEESTEPIEKKIKVTIEDDRSKRYCARIIEDLKVKPSPFWLRKELEACGLRSINNVVDATNYIMLKFGHPLHAFDYEKIENKQLKVSTESNKTLFECLDKEKRQVPKNTLLIKDGKKTVAIAGIIGGMNSAVSDNTKIVVLEAAHFDSLSIRKSSKELGLKTESSMRFEKSIDPKMIPIAIDYAAELIAQIANGKIIKGKIDVVKDDFLPKKLPLRTQKAKKILGTQISANEMAEIFRRLEFQVLEMNDEVTLLEIPTFRNDINLEIDLIEEIARIYGYNNLAKVNPYYRSSFVSHSKGFMFEKQLKSFLRSLSLQEFKTCDLISPKLAEIAIMNLDRSDLIQVKHYKSIDQSILRPTLLPSLLEVIKFNHDYKNFDILAYEIGNIHYKENNKFIEKPTLSIILTGKRNPHLWDKSNFDVNFYDIKGILENLFKVYLTKKYKFKSSSFKGFHTHKQASLTFEDKDFGVIAEVHPNVLKAFDIKKRVFFAEIDLAFLMKNKKKDIHFKEISQYPSSHRDLTISLDEKVEVQKIFDIIEKIDSLILEKTYLLDIFKSLGGKNNVTFRFIYKDSKKTISSEEVEKEHLKITDKITKQLEK